MVGMNFQNLCPVCGYEMQLPPQRYDICPSCGTEFGVHDENASIPELQMAWLRDGLKWWSQSDPIPENWNPFEQLERVMQLQGAFSTAQQSTVVVLPFTPWGVSSAQQPADTKYALTGY